MSGVVRGFSAAIRLRRTSPQTLVPPCSSKKLLIFELDTYARSYQSMSDSWMDTSWHNTTEVVSVQKW